MNGKWRISIEVIAGLLALAPISSTVYAAIDVKIADQSDYCAGFEK